MSPQPKRGKAAEAKPETFKFELDDETKGAARFAEVTGSDSERGMIRTLYIRKEGWEAKFGKAKKLKVTIEVDED